jgi:regulatory protein
MVNCIRYAVAVTKVYTFERSLNYVLWLLSRQAYTRHQLEERLRKKQVSPEVIERVLHKLESMKFVDDARFAEQYIHSWQKQKGRLKLKRELCQKGVAEETVMEMLEALDDEAEVASARALLEKQLPKIQKAELRQRYGKAYAFLARKGFSSHTIRHVLEEAEFEEIGE